MTKIEWALTPEDIEWEMDWSQRKEDGTRSFPEKPEKEMVFEEKAALAHLLINDVIFLNDHWWEKEWPEDAKKTFSLNVNCNDVFAWGTADAEELPYGELENLYRMWLKEPSWGAAVWCLIKRRELPQRPVANRMTDAGWDLDALAKEHNLRPNVYDGLSGLFARRKYAEYCRWERERENEPRPFDKHWWDGWREYQAAHPDFKPHSGEWHDEDMRLRAEWLKDNGFKENDDD